MKKWFLFLNLTILLAGQVYALEKVEKGLKENFERLLEAGEISQAKELVEKIFTEDKNNSFYYLLCGKIYFYQGEYLQARDCIVKSLEMTPSPLEAHQLESRRKLYEFYDSVYKTNKDFQEFVSEHFRLRVKSSDIILKDYALEALEKIYQGAGKEFGVEQLQYQILVEIYPSEEDFLLASTLTKKEVETSGAIGICKFNRIMIVSPRLLLFGYRWLNTLAHEYIHYLVNRISLYNCPLWLHEGIAKYFEKKITLSYTNNVCLTPVYQHLLANAREEGKLISFARMSPSLVKLDSQEEVSLAFAQVANTVDYLVRTYSKEKLISLLDEFKKIENQETAFLKVYGLSPEQIEKKWQNSLEKTDLRTYPGVSLEKIKFQTEQIQIDEVEEYVGTDVRGHIRLGDKFRLRNRYDTALAEYEEALKKEPNNPLILNKIAKTYVHLSNLSKAEENFKKAILTNPDYGASYFNLGELYLNQGKYEDAKIQYKEYLQINPFNPYLHKNLGLVYFYLKDNLEAEKEWQIAKIFLPEDYEIHSWLNQLQWKK